MDIDNTQEEIARIEEQMNDPHLWQDKEKAQAIIQEYNRLKDVAAKNLLGHAGRDIKLVLGY